MITGPVTNAQLKSWKEIYDKFKDKLIPNRKSGAEVLDYLHDNYILKEVFDKSYLDVISENVMNNEYLRERLHEDSAPVPVGYILQNEGNGTRLYENQEKLWENCPIFVGVDLNSGYVHVEGSCVLHDELFAFQGIDDYDLKNYVITATYIECIKEFCEDYYNSILS